MLVCLHTYHIGGKADDQGQKGVWKFPSGNDQADRHIAVGILFGCRDHEALFL